MQDPRKKFRRMVSLKKRRFQDEEFDLDLAYITERIIAFGFPAEGHEALFRNPMEACQRFLEKKHKDRYFVYNLCIEKDRQYKDKKFNKRVAKFQFADHNAPPLEMIPKFCEHAANWLNEHPENIIAVHCKAGKGRTGVMISCLLMYMNMYPIAEEAMAFYGNQRTHNGNGVTIPSQRRFINYYETVLKYELPAKHEAALFKRLYIENISNFEDYHFGISVESNGTMLTHKKKGDAGVEYTLEDNAVMIDMGSVPVSGNAKITLYNKKKEPICWFWFHCAYIQKEYRMAKKDIDKAATDKKHLVFLEDFMITAYFEDLTYRQFIHGENVNNNNNNNNNNHNGENGNHNNNNNDSNSASDYSEDG